MCFRCGLEDHQISDFPKPKNQNKKFHQNIKNPKTCAYKSTKVYKLDKNTKHNESHKIYVSIAHMSSNVESPRRYFGDNLKLNNRILDSGATCHMKPDI